MEIFAIVYDTIAMFMPIALIVIAVIGVALYAGVLIWAKLDNRKQAREKAEHEAKIESMRGAYFRKRNGQSS